MGSSSVFLKKSCFSFTEGTEDYPFEPRFSSADTTYQEESQPQTIIEYSLP